MKLFVYGTLKKGQYFHNQYLANGTYLGEAVTSEDYIIYISGLPHMVREVGAGPVLGELYEINAETLKTIDELEGTPYCFKREMITVKDKEGKMQDVWAYIYPNIFKDKNSQYKIHVYE